MIAAQPARSIDALFERQGVHVVTHSCVAAAGHVAELDPGEFEHVRNAIASRQQEFAGGRTCAHASMRALGVSASPLLAAANRSPVWPTGCVGSITHTEGYCFASVCVDASVSIGIDAELVGRVTDEVAAIALSETERRRVARSESPDVAATAVFAAKEALYKAQHPLTDSWLGFDDVEVDETSEQGLLRLRYIGASEPPVGLTWPVAARWTLIQPDRDSELVAAAIAIRPA